MHYTTICMNWVQKTYVELIEHPPCNDIYELRAREGHFIREIATLSKQIAGRTHKQWYDDNFEAISQKQREHRQK